MVYKVGISTGWWRIAKTPELLGMAAKIAYGATAGVTFVQIDLETTSEFLEPGLDYQVKRVKELGMEIGVHAEVGEGHGPSVTPAVRPPPPGKQVLVSS